MPLAFVTWRRGVLEEKGLQGLQKQLPTVVARHLHCDGTVAGHLTQEDIVVQFRDAGPWDVLTHDVQVTVFANDYPERRENRGDRARRILEEVCAIVDDEKDKKLSVDVYVLLGAGGFAERL